VASSWQSFIDAAMLDLTTNVSGLRDVREHRYSPYDPEELVAEVGERHLSIFPVAAQAQVAEPLLTGPGGDLITETYRVTYWEHAGDESSRGISDEEAAADLLTLAEGVRDRFYDIDNLRLGGAHLVRYIGTAFPERSGQVRWFAIGVQAHQHVHVA
jgi:hypothetical protein